ncbi:nuclear pore complex protein NUP43 [Humulus lupulus]|uniref:nuclear pore complex protein NUP43 n=1 Tax=Humulus lupulus TaxID=3486 RepID=UPI002B410BC5|nr:nuclear pore complex protein NUP43 [Humulus lupulus]
MSKTLKPLTMAITPRSEPPQIQRFPQSKYIDAVRWLPPVTALDRFAAIAFFDSDSDSSSVEIYSVGSNPANLVPQSSWVSPSRVYSLKTSHSQHRPFVAAGTFSSSLHVLFSNPMDASSLESELSIPGKVLHEGPISCIDLMDGELECLTVGEDGKVNVVSIGASNLNHRRVFDSSGLVSYTATKWASPAEFATGGCGFSLQWWDQRKPGGAVSQFKGNWAQRTSGIIHSIDVHPSRKHTCLAGGSLGTVFAWDLRWPQQPIILSGVGTGDAGAHSPSESEVWEVQYDRYAKSVNMGNSSSSKILPAMICSEDGILAVIEQGEEPLELVAEPCAINSFDIDCQNPSDVICSLEWESIAVLSRS